MSPVRRSLCALLLLALVGRSAWASEPEVHLTQARLYLKRGWPEAAAEELRTALATPAGRARYDVCWMAAGVAWEILDIDWALEMAEAAAAAAPDEDRRQEARALAQSYREGFGFLVVEAPHLGMVSRLQLESTGLVLDPERKRYIQRAALAWRERTPLPARLGLPVGSYTINGHAVTITAGQEVVLPLPMSALGGRGLAALQVTRLEASVGIRSVTGSTAATEGLLPSLHTQLTLTQPVGPVLLGAALGHTAMTYRAEGNILAYDSAWTASARLGREVVLDGALSLRPAAIFGYGALPGLGIRCSEDACAPAADGESADRFVQGGAWLGGGELLVEYREAGRTTALGTGVKLSTTHAWGTLPEDADGTPLSARRWAATDLLMLANLSLAL